MALFNPARDITQSSLGSVLTPIGKSIANQLVGAFPALKNGLRSNGSGNNPIIAEPLQDRRLFEPSTQMLVFPLDLPDQIAHFKMELKEYTKPSSDGAGQQGKNLGAIYLPLPSNLGESFAMSYNTAQFGPVLGDPSTLKTIGNLGEAAGQAVRGNPRQAAQSLRAAGVEGGALAGKVGSSLGPALLRAGVKAVTGALGGNTAAAGQFTDLFLGATPNPGFALLFQSNTFRSFVFTWRLAPKSQEESKKLAEIVALIKFGMHPNLESFFLEFPCRVFPQISVKNGNIFNFKPCVITKFDINYAPGAVPAFFVDGKPLEVDITIGLQETEIFTRKDFQKQQPPIDYNSPN